MFALARLKLPSQYLTHHLRIRSPLGLLHNLSYKEGQGLFFARLEVYHCLGVRCNDSLDCRLDCRDIADLTQPKLGCYFPGRLAGVKHLLENLFYSWSGEGTLIGHVE